MVKIKLGHSLNQISPDVFSINGENKINQTKHRKQMCKLDDNGMLKDGNYVK